MSLSVCLLTRNEEKNIARALQSVVGIADEVIVADTASTDRTCEIAAGLGAKVHACPWQDDFGAGRNFAIAQAKSDWILWLNADEELLPASHELTRSCMAREDAFGYFVLIHNLFDADRPDHYSETADVRLFRRRPDLAFVGCLHPHFGTPLVEAIKRDGQQVFPSTITLRSTAYLTARTESKLRWTIRLLERELQQRPGQLHYLIEYGRTLLMLKDAKGHAILAEAAAQVLPARQAAAAPSMKVQLLLEYLLSAAPEASQCCLSQDEARELALRWFPASPPLLYKVAEQCFRREDYDQATQLLERLVHLGKTGTYDKSRPFDPGLVGDDALVNLAACARQRGDWPKAEHCYRQLLNSKHFHAQAVQGLAAVEAVRRQTGRFSFDLNSGS